MGHAKFDTTLNVYTQVVDGSLRRAADTVGSELFTIVHKPEATTLEGSEITSQNHRAATAGRSEVANSPAWSTPAERFQITADATSAFHTPVAAVSRT